MLGYARNTQLNKDYLEGCEAVEKWEEQDAEVIRFKFDPQKQPQEIPEGVFFDLTASPF